MSSGLPTWTLSCALVALALAAPAGAAPALASWGSLPVSFEPNRGQAPSSVDFVARSRDGVGMLAGGALTLRFDRSHAVRMSLAGARPQMPEGLKPLPGITSYFHGSDPSRWIAGIPTYGEVLYREVLPGVDLRYHGSGGHLELDMVLAPNANPGRLRLAFDGADRVAVLPNGDLQLSVAGQPLTLRRPIAYQEIAGERRAVASEYVVKGPRAVAIALGERDRSQPVVVDPVLVYSAQLGGSGDDGLEAVAVDSSGAVYAAGYAGPAFPIVGGTQGLGGSSDVVVLKLNPSGSSLVYSVYLGGSFPDHAYGIAVDSAGNAIVAGETPSGDYPVASAIQSTFAGGSTEAFVTKINAAGNALVYSTYVGGSQTEAASAVAVDASGNAYITGGTQSSNWVVTPSAYQATKAGQRDAFVLKLSPSGTRLYSTFVGGGQEDYGQGIAVNGGGEMFVAGATSSSDFPTANAYQSSIGGGQDAFVLKLSSAGNQLLFSTYLGDVGDDTAEGLALHLTTGGPVIVGQTLSIDFPTTPGAYDTTSNPGWDAFVAELSATGSLTFSTFLGGSGNDFALAVAQGLTGGPWIAGRTTSSTDFPTAGSPYQGTGPGAGDAFVVQLHGDGSALDYSTYLGGTDDDRALGIALDNAGGVYVVGQAGAAFPFTPGAYRNTGLLADAFAAKLREPFTLTQVNPSTGPTVGGTQVTLGGTGFTPNLMATFGDASVPTTYAGATTLVASSPPHAAGPVDVQVVALDGTKSNLVPNGFTYVSDGGGGTDGGGGGDGGVPDGGVPGRPLDVLGCSCAAGISSSTAFAFAMLAAIAARSRQRRKPTSAPPSQ
ncbi:MAG TPA: SBBP repeat-containing protein [Myxococcaceae bacterium]